MGRASRKRRHNAKMNQKRQIKAARRAAYAAMAGTSKKAKRQGKKNVRDRRFKHAHAMLDCGNVGCKRCYPRMMYHGATGLHKEE